VTRVVPFLVMALAVSLSGLVAASPASAVTSSVPYVLTSGDPVLTTDLGTDSTGPCVAGSTSGSYPYKVVRFKVSATDSYTVSDSGAQDARVGIYSGAFDPANPLTGCLAFSDVTVTVPLTAGTTYTLVQSTSTTTLTGAFSIAFDGAGTASVLAATSTTLTTTPNPSELSKATTLRAVVAGGATPTGTVQFREGVKVLGSAALSGGVAQLAVSSLAVGDHTLSATYLGDGTHEPSADTHVHKVKYGPKPKVKLWVSDKTVAVGDKIKLTWVTTSADTVKASGDWKGSRTKKGAKKVRVKGLGAHVYKLQVENVNGIDTARIRVVAVRAPKDFTVALPDDVITAGTKVRVRAARLDAKERFKVFLDGDLLRKGFADKRGLVNALVTIPRKVKEGEHTISVMGSNDDRVGELDVLIVASTKALDVEVAKAKVMPKKTNKVSVSGLVEGEDVTVMYQGEILTEGVADAQGEFEYTFPVGSESGVQSVTVLGQVPTRTGEATFQVLTGTGPDV
jgi:plastocyanin